MARLPGSAKVAPGERLDLAIDRGDLHLFDAESGERKGG